jgi:outer membrane receptor protein involved in Fe transport
VVVLLDGVRLNNALSGGVDLATIPRDLVERIEVSRGGGSITTGSDAIGGVVNIITRSASGAPQTTATFSAGSWNTFHGSLTQTGTLVGLEGLAAYDGFGSDGDWKFRPATRIVDGVPVRPPGSFERVNNDQQRHSGLVRIGRDLGSWGRVRFTDSFLYQAGGEPGPDNLGGGILGQSLTARRKRIRNVADLKLEFADATSWLVSGQARVFHRYDQNRFHDSAPRFGPPLATRQEIQSVGSRVDIEKTFTTRPVEQRAAMGLELRQDWLEQRTGPQPDRLVIGVFVQDEISAWEDWLRLVPALRFDATEGYDNQWLPRLGVIVQPLPWLRIQGNIERSYRVPHFDELFLDEEFVRGNPNLRPEEAVNADIGFIADTPDIGPISETTLEFAWFHNEIDDSIVFVPVNAFLVVASNTGSAVAKGYELALAFRMWDWLSLSTNWTHLDTRRDVSGSPLPGRARDEVFAGAQFGPPSGMFRLFASQLYTSKIPVNFAGSTVVGARSVWDVGVVLDLLQLPGLSDRVPGQELLVSFTASNVSDQSVRDTQFFPQPGRALTFRVEWRL